MAQGNAAVGAAFTPWLSALAGRDDPVGDLARAAIRAWRGRWLAVFEEAVA